MSESVNKTPHPSFEWLRTETIESLHVAVSEYRHRVTGALHFHIHAANDENVFLVALRTVPTDSTGVAHILEHTVLCGSEKYPVRDPFFMMIRRSLNTFMNAFTASDWTAYPFATRNAKDFDNLLSVYLDAVFFSRLDPLDFAQEGHRLEFSEADNPASELMYKGVVYNEMKGAMSSPTSVLYDELGRYLFPTSTYHYNSGGDPETITDLSYSQLKQFYDTHYHPSNAVFMTFGDKTPAELQEAFETRALHRFKALERTIAVQPEKRYGAPLRVDSAYATDLDADENVDNRTHLVMAWLLDASTDLESQLKAHLLSDVLLDNSASPLRKLLENCGLGTAPSPLCGLESSNLEMAFMCGLEGSSPQQAEAFETQVMDLLTSLAADGIAQEKLEAALHQLELSQREIGGDHYPYGLQLIMSSLSTAMHRGDPIALLNLDPVLDKLREEIKQPDFLPNLIRSWLLDNPHRVRLSLRPDPQLEANKAKQQRKILDAIHANLDSSQQQAIVEQAQALEARQSIEEDESVLPKVDVADIPAAEPLATSADSDTDCGLISEFAAGTNGLVYQQLFYEMPDISPEQQQLLPIFSRTVAELGAGKQDYLQIQEALTAATGGVHGLSIVRAMATDEQSVRGLIGFSGKALARHQADLTELMHAIAEEPRFDEHKHLRDLIAQQRARMERSITGNGHALAMTAACSAMSPVAALNHRIGGLAGIVALKERDNSLDDQHRLAELATDLEALSQHLRTGQRRFVIVGEADTLPTARESIMRAWGSAPASNSNQPLALDPIRASVQQAWLTSTQVNFCARAYPTVPSDHADAPVLAVLGGFLRNGYLHRAIREQGGAYGGGASQDSSISAFKFYSYRDPRLEETLSDFDRALDWLHEHAHSEQALEEAILGVIGSLDKPGSPAGEAKQAYQSKLFGRGDEFQQRFRARVVGTTLADLQRVASTYLDPARASTAVITQSQRWESAKLARDDFSIFTV